MSQLFASGGQNIGASASAWKGKNGNLFRKLKQELCINLEGWDGEGDGREIQKGEDICIPMVDSCWGLTENSKIL